MAAFDTKAKRLAILNFGQPWCPRTLPEPQGGVTTLGRYQLDGLYSPEPTPPPPANTNFIAVQVPDPRFMSWDLWSATVSDRVRGVGMYNVAEDQWRDWAYFMLNSLPLNQIRVPDPDRFVRWQDWATELVVANAGGL